MLVSPALEDRDIRDSLAGQCVQFRETQVPVCPSNRMDSLGETISQVDLCTPPNIHAHLIVYTGTQECT